MSGQYQQTQHKVRTVPTDSKECQLSGQYHQTTECQISTTRLQNFRSVPLDSTECQVSTARLQNVRSVPRTIECQCSTNRLCRLPCHYQQTLYRMSGHFHQTLLNVKSVPTDYRMSGQYHLLQNVRSVPTDSTECQVNTTKPQNLRQVPPDYIMSSQYHLTPQNIRSVLPDSTRNVCIAVPPDRL